MNMERKMTRARRLTRLLAVALLTACACSSSPSRADYITQMDKLCQASKDASKNRPAATTIVQQAANLSAVNNDNQVLLGKLRAVTPPKDDKAQVDKILGEFNQLLIKGRALEAAARVKDAKTYNAGYADIGNVQRQATADAQAYGF